jgi:hypothetical protein
VTLENAFFPWTNGLDIHLLPGMSSPRLDQLLWLQYSGTPKKIVQASAHEPATTVTFSARFAGAPNAHGVTLDPAKGRIMVGALPAGPQLRSFIVTATASEGGASPVSGSRRLRVHVHRDVKQLWLTPRRLTVRQGAQSMRLTVLARFDDDVVGDVTNWAPFVAVQPGQETFATRGGNPAPFLRWSSSSAGTVDVDPTTGVLDAKAAAGSATISVTAGPLPAPVALTGSATVTCAAAWATPVKLVPLEGSTFASIPQRRNVLILPEGFTAGERTKFLDLATLLVHRLQTREKTRPFDLLSHRINYFAAWVPSPDGGVSVLNELSPGRLTVSDQAVPYPQPAGGGAWTLETLIDEVGLPIPNTDLPGTPLGTAALGRLHDWQTLYGPQVTAGQVTGLHNRWLGLFDRLLADENDTAFHMAFSVRPNLSLTAPARSLAPNPRRLANEDFDVFLDALRDAAGNALPRAKNWSTGAPDDDNIVMLCRSVRHGGANSSRTNPAVPDAKGHLIGMSLGERDTHAVVLAPPGARVDPDAIPAQPTAAMWTTMAHELAHSWTLLDEYKEQQTLTPERLASIKESANVQEQSALLVGGSLSSQAIKWLWPRVDGGGELKVDPQPVGDHFRLVLKDGFTIKRGDVVRLRTRPLLTSTTSGRWRVTDLAGNEAQVKPLPGVPAGELTAFTVAKGSIVVRPVRKPDPNAANDQLGDDLLLVADSVRAWIAAQHNPLNAAAGAAPNRPWAAEPIPVDSPTPARNIPPGGIPNPPRYSSWIVGLYEEGADVVRDVYRPTGICLMRMYFIVRDASGNPLPPNVPRLAYQFCPVCRYAIVDLLDPAKHKEIDADYAKRYPG